LNALTTDGYGGKMAVEAKGTLELSNNKCLWPVEAAARDFRGLKQA